MRGDIRERPAAEESSLSPTLRTVLARQSLIMSAIFNLTEMVEDLLLASGKPRRPLFEDIATREAMTERPARNLFEIQGQVAHGTKTLPGADPDGADLTLAARSTDFGVLRRRRRRTVLMLLAALLLAISLAWKLPALIGYAESPVPTVAKTANELPGAPEAVAAAGGSRSEEAEVPNVSGRSLEEADLSEP